MNRMSQHAVVIGAGIGGLLAARVLAEHYGRVTLVERDWVVQADAPRKGVPQGHHAHGLLARGREVLERFFPGLTAELSTRGACRGDLSADCIWYNHGGYLGAAQSGLEGLLVSRALLEAYLRRRLLAFPNVRLVEQCDARGLVAGERGRRVRGLRVSRRRGGDTEEMLPADLIVDASGRGSRSPAWLDTLGYGRAEEEKVEVDRFYTSRLYRRDPRQAGGKLAIVSAPCEPLWRSGVALAQEGQRWILSLGGYFGDRAPDDEHGFLEFARTLPAGEIYDIAAKSEPLAEFARFKFPCNLRRRYERLTAFPEGYLVFGDALCSFNPIYGQGMTVAALEAFELQRCLAHGTYDLAQRFFRAAAQIIDVPWQIGVGNDLRVPGVKGRRSARVRFINWYMGKLQTAARTDPTLTTDFLNVANLMALPPSLLSPNVALRVLRGNLRTAMNPGAGARRALQPS